jgi:hypothetical protein
MSPGSNSAASPTTFSAAAAKPVVVRRPRTEFEVDFAIWKDMIEEPAKYGDDICEWVALNEKLTHGSGRWRLAAHWTELQAEEDAKAEALVAPWRALYSQCAKEAAVAGERAWCRRDVKRYVARIRNAVVTIQAAVRGHQVRTASPYLNCCMCLSHRICPLKTDVGMMCRSCAEQGPYDEETGPIADPWSEFRADFADLTVKQCCECRFPLEDGQVAFCNRDCEYSYMKDTLRNT